MDRNGIKSQSYTYVTFMVVSLRLTGSTLQTYIRNAALLITCWHACELANVLDAMLMWHLEMWPMLTFMLCILSHHWSQFTPKKKIEWPITIYIYIDNRLHGKRVHPRHQSKQVRLKAKSSDYQAKEEHDLKWGPENICCRIRTFVNRRRFKIKEGASRDSKHVQKPHVGCWFLKVGAKNLHIIVQNTVLCSLKWFLSDGHHTFDNWYIGFEKPTENIIQQKELK